MAISVLGQDKEPGMCTNTAIWAVTTRIGAAMAWELEAQGDRLLALVLLRDHIC